MGEAHSGQLGRGFDIVKLGADYSIGTSREIHFLNGVYALVLANKDRQLDRAEQLTEE